MVLPLILGAASLALEYGPTLAHHLFGEKGGEVATAASDIIRAATGTDDEAAQRQVLGSDPDKAAQVRVQLAQLAAGREKAWLDAELARMQAEYADTANARGQTMALVQAGSAVAWGAPIVSALVIAGFVALSILVMFRTVPEGSMSLALGLLEAAKILAVTVVGYWCGSSSGSAEKTRLLAQAPAIPLTGPARESRR